MVPWCKGNEVIPNLHTPVLSLSTLKVEDSNQIPIYYWAVGWAGRVYPCDQLGYDTTTTHYCGQHGVTYNTNKAWRGWTWTLSRQSSSYSSGRWRLRGADRRQVMSQVRVVPSKVPTLVLIRTRYEMNASPHWIYLSNVRTRWWRATVNIFSPTSPVIWLLSSKSLIIAINFWKEPNSCLQKTYNEIDEMFCFIL